MYYVVERTDGRNHIITADRVHISVKGWAFTDAACSTNSWRHYSFYGPDEVKAIRCYDTLEAAKYSCNFRWT